ncbi:MAG: large repetitive protein [Frankiales bacterium]|nr:large repetitive protein [Frankiales bacterium]
MRCARTIASTAAVSVVMAVAGVMMAAPVAQAATASLVEESFTGTSTTPPKWVLPAASTGTVANDACLAASTDTSTTPIPGCAASGGTAGLQLTTAAEGQEGGLAYSSSVPSSLGLDVSFDSYQYAGSGADGIVFFLAASDPTNASASPLTLGPAGGHLGYSADTSSPTATPGLTHAYLGVGLDVYGNFTSHDFAQSTCPGSTASSPQSLTVRGPGNDTSGYCLLRTAAAGPLDSGSAVAVPVEVAVNPTGGELISAGGLTVPAGSWAVKVTPVGASPVTESGPLPDATSYVPDSSWVNGQGVPHQLTFGWSASTGAATDYHTIANATVQTLNGTPPTLAVSLVDNSGGNGHDGQTVTYSATAAVTDADETRTITMTDTFPAGLTPQAAGLGGADWSCGVSGQTVTCTHAPAAKGVSLAPVAMPVLVTVASGSPPLTLADTVTVGSPDATQGSATDTQTYSAVPVIAYTDPGAVAENTSWPNAALLTTAGTSGALAQAGEARWFKFPVVPSSQVNVDLSQLAQNYDLTLYNDIGAAFSAPAATTDLNILGAEQSGNAYSPSIYSPSIYSPSIYSPSIYSPSIYSPSIYSPSIYSPSIYSPSIYSPSIYSPSIYSPSDAFLQAFSNAQTRSLIGISALDGTASETISAATWNNSGYFYVRVAGRNGAFSASPFRLDLAVTGGPCTGITLNSFAGNATLTGTPGGAKTVVLTDSTRLSLTTAGLSADLTRLASATGGAVVDVSQSARVAALNRQADANPSCSYAKNLVAQAIRDIVNSFRDTSGTLKYVAIIGGDSVIPFFRYPDAAGLGPENGYVPPVLGTSASQASLQSNNVLGQDAYGALSDLTIKGSVLPVPDLAVGRLVETPAEIDGQIQQFLGLTRQTLPTPKSSLVTGYDFLTSAADQVEGSLQAGLGAGARNDQLITNQGVPTTTVTGSSGPSRTTSWTATDLSSSLFGSHHDVVFLAGHFSANSTLAADYSTSLVTPDVAAHPGAFTNSLVFSAGCHSGYNIVDSDGVPGLTLGLDWSQEMAQQKAILIAGTGYQYADTNFLAYSAKIYTMFAAELRAGAVGTPVAIGQALVRAKQAYLESLSTVGGIDQKAVIESTMYGLPMTGIDLPGARTGIPANGPTVTPSDVTPGTPGSTLGLQTAVVTVATPTTPHTSPVLGLTGTATGQAYSWLSGTDGTLTQPALPALPEQYVPATSTGGQSLRGVGFRSGTYTDAPGVTPLTGAPTTEQNGVHTTFSSTSFFPQNLFSVNYFDALGGTGSSGQTKVVLTPAQYRSDSASTNTVRTYSNVGLSLFYSSNIATYGQNRPALAQAPSITLVSSTVNGSSVSVSAHVTGDPSAGIQQVWTTYTGEAGPFHGAWASIELTQDPTDSTLWSATLPLPSGQNAADVRLMVQAVNGVGVVGVDNNLGSYYTPGVAVGVSTTGAPTTLTLDTVPATVAYGTNLTVGATLVGAPAGSVVTFDIGGQGAVPAVTAANGHASASIRVLGNPGGYRVNAAYNGAANYLSSSARSPLFTVLKAPTALTLSSTKKVFALGGAPKLPALRVTATGTVAPPGTSKAPVYDIDTGLVATLTSAGQPMPQRSVLFTLKGLLTKQTVTAVRTTDLRGNAFLSVVSLMPDVYTITAVFGVAQAGSTIDPVYASSAIPPATVALAPGLTITIVFPTKP